MTYRLAWKVLGLNGEPVHGGKKSWPLPPRYGTPGKWMEESGPISACHEGTLHGCADAMQLLHWINAPAVWVIEIDEGRGFQMLDDKCAFKRSRLTHRVEHWNETTMRLFAADCAEQVSHLSGDEARFGEILRVVRRYALGIASKKELVSAWASARGAAWASARNSAWNEAWAWQAARLLEYLHGRVDIEAISRSVSKEER